MLGNNWRSYWRHADQALNMVMVKKALPEDEDEAWDWMRNPLPPASESNDFLLMRRALRLREEDCVASPEAIRSLAQPDLAGFAAWPRFLLSNITPSYGISSGVPVSFWRTH